MGKEKEIIELIDKYMPRSPNQLNRLFEADSEIIALSCGSMLYNIDEFSEEDLFSEDDPYTLGWNLAAGSISDIFASGGKPLYYAHSMVVQDTWSKAFIDKLAQGIAKVLKETGTVFIGGDLGISGKWRYTGSVIGKLEGYPLLRSGAKIGDSIFITGLIGRGNVEAALKLFGKNDLINMDTEKRENTLPLRDKEAELIRKYSCCCIDTSDGVFNALNEVAEQSQTGFEIGDLPYVKKGLALAKVLKIPQELLFLGECGEYELLFTLKKDIEGEFITGALKEKLSFYKIGEVTKETKVLREKDKELDLTDCNLKARDYPKPEEYLQDVLYFLDRRSK